VLRHQLAVLRRQVARPRFSWSDRALIAALAKLVPRDRWRAFLISPNTILGWHRALVRGHWTFAHRRTGRPRLSEETVQLIVRLARENPRWGYRPAPCAIGGSKVVRHDLLGGLIHEYELAA
jgi:putative transposase